MYIIVIISLIPNHGRGFKVKKMVRSSSSDDTALYSLSLSIHKRLLDPRLAKLDFDGPCKTESLCLPRPSHHVFFLSINHERGCHKIHGRHLSPRKSRSKRICIPPFSAIAIPSFLCKPTHRRTRPSIIDPCPFV
jgi:hypothetical protein